MHSILRSGFVASVLVAAVTIAVPRAQAARIYVLTADDQDLIQIDSAAPQDVITAIPLGTATNDRDWAALDIRPSNGLLYAFDDAGLNYTVNPATGQTTQVGGSGALTGSRFGVDFDPVADAVQFVADTDQTARNDFLNPPAPGPVLFYAAGQPGATGDNPGVTAIAFTNSVNPAPASTTLYGIDVRDSEDRLVTIDPATGSMTVVGALGTDVSAVNGFDIAFIDGQNVAYAALQPVNSGISYLYSINLGTGTAAQIGQIAGGDLVDGLTVVPEPTVLSIASSAALAAFLPRRRRSV